MQKTAMNGCVVFALKRELDGEIKMIDKPCVIPDWMLKTLKDNSMLRAKEMLEIAGYKESSLNALQRTIKRGGIPEPTKKPECKFGKTSAMLWKFGDVKKWVKEHNEKLTA